jgi:hypothetical protein
MEDITDGPAIKVAAVKDAVNKTLRGVVAVKDDSK